MNILFFIFVLVWCARRGLWVRKAEKRQPADAFFYDGQGKPGLVTYSGSDHYYIYNLQGDVVGLVGPSNQWVVEYRYDPWGKQLACTGARAATLRMDNPFRYRGYIITWEA